MVQSERVDSFWNEKFKEHVKPAMVGRPAEGLNFETSIKQMIDCRLLGFKDGAQVINYITSHDVAGKASERLYQFLEFNKVAKKEERFKLAFVCLLTAVGIPMILAGEEFADEMDIDIFDKVSDNNAEKQIDPVNYSRLDDEWRKRIFNYVARLVKFRTNSAALSINDTEFIHVDLNEGKQVLVWKRGRGSDLVVVVANFSEWGTDIGNSNATYVVPNWPSLPPGRSWREITQDRDVPTAWAGREPLFPFEAKVYAMI
jgi:pullulanase/glycogen debranching enzyme